MEKVHVQERRAYRNALERKRRDQLKSIFKNLKDVIPSLQTEKKPSRATILKKSAEHIRFMKKKNAAQWQDLEVLQQQNSALEAQIAAMESENSSDDGDEVQPKEEIREELEEFCEVSDSSDSEYSYPTSFHKNKKVKIQEPYDFN